MTGDIDATHPERLEGLKLPDSDGLVTVELTVNGMACELKVRSTETLLDALRARLKLVGARSGCGVGMCGACTLIRDGRAISGCLTLAALCDGADVHTVEGLRDTEGRLSRVQAAFIEHRAFQCSFCTSGFMLALQSLLNEKPQPTEDEVREAFSGHVCRCGSYSRIMAAARQVAEPAPPGSEESDRSTTS